MAFELYATGAYGFHDLIKALTDAGLRTKPNKRYPAGTPISLLTIGKLLRDRYYLGYVTHKGVEYKGRHEPLVDQALFDRVQEILDGHRGGGMRARIHKDVDTAINATATTNAELIDGIKQQITKLDTQEDQYLDLIGDPDWPKDKIAERLRKIREERARLEQKIAQADRPDLESGANALRTVLELLERPDKLYDSPANEYAGPSIKRSSPGSTSTPTTHPHAYTTTSRQPRSRRSSPYTGPNNAKAAAPLT